MALKQTPMKSTKAISTIGRIPAIAAPVAMPMKPVSEIGVSTTRCAPNSSAMPTVVPNTPPNFAMSSPMTKMLGSLRISAMTASRPARAIVRVRLEPPLLGASCAMLEILLRKDPLERLVRRGIFAVAAKLHGLVHFLLHSRLERLHRGGRKDLLIQQPLAVSRDRVLLRGDFVLRAVAGRVTDEMSVQALGLELENRGALASTRVLYRARGSLENQIRVVALDILTGAVVTGSALPGRDDCGLLRRHRHGVLVVLDHAHERQLPQGGHVHHFVK